MWSCPACRRSFLNRNQWHACTDLTVAAHLERHSDVAQEIYRTFEAAVLRHGDVRIHPQKTRIAFINVMSFAGVSLARHHVDARLILPCPTDHPLVRKVEIFGPTGFGHTVRLTVPDEVASIESLIEGAAERGRRTAVEASANPEPITGRLLDVTISTFSAHVSADGLTVPDYVAAAFALHPDLLVKLAGHPWSSGALIGSRLPSGPGTVLVVDRLDLASAGIDEGSKIDVTVRAAPVHG